MRVRACASVRAHPCSPSCGRLPSDAVGPGPSPSTAALSEHSYESALPLLYIEAGRCGARNSAPLGLVAALLRCAASAPPSSRPGTGGSCDRWGSGSSPSVAQFPCSPLLPPSTAERQCTHPYQQQGVCTVTSRVLAPAGAKGTAAAAAEANALQLAFPCAPTTASSKVSLSGMEGPALNIWASNPAAAVAAAAAPAEGGAATCNVTTAGAAPAGKQAAGGAGARGGFALSGLGCKAVPAAAALGGGAAKAVATAAPGGGGARGVVYGLSVVAVPGAKAGAKGKQQQQQQKEQQRCRLVVTAMGREYMHHSTETFPCERESTQTRVCARAYALLTGGGHHGEPQGSALQGIRRPQHADALLASPFPPPSTPQTRTPFRLQGRQPRGDARRRPLPLKATRPRALPPHGNPKAAPASPSPSGRGRPRRAL